MVYLLRYWLNSENSVKKLTIVKICDFESEGSFQMGNSSINHIVFKKFSVMTTIDGKHSVGYVLGSVPPPKGCGTLPNT